MCYARVLDFRRKFIEAAQRYNELSYKSIVHESERLEALKHALNCTILASAGTTAKTIVAGLGSQGNAVNDKLMTVVFTTYLVSNPFAVLCFRPATFPYVGHSL